MSKRSKSPEEGEAKVAMTVGMSHDNMVVINHRDTSLYMIPSWAKQVAAQLIQCAEFIESEENKNE